MRESLPRTGLECMTRLRRGTFKSLGPQMVLHCTSRVLNLAILAVHISESPFVSTFPLSSIIKLFQHVMPLINCVY